MSGHPLSTLLVSLCLALAGWSCSWRYDTDDLRGDDSPADVDDDGTDDAAAGDGDPDAAPPVDASSPDAAVNPGTCGDVGEVCCETEPSCGFGDEFIECDGESGLCAPCGHLDEPCCQTGPECEGLLGCLGLVGLIETCVL